MSFLDRFIVGSYTISCPHVAVCMLQVCVEGSMVDPKLGLAKKRIRGYETGPLRRTYWESSKFLALKELSLASRLSIYLVFSDPPSHCKTPLFKK